MTLNNSVPYFKLRNIVTQNHISGFFCIDANDLLCQNLSKTLEEILYKRIETIFEGITLNQYELFQFILAEGTPQYVEIFHRMQTGHYNLFVIPETKFIASCYLIPSHNQLLSDDKNEILEQVVHDIKNPLSVVAGYIDLLTINREKFETSSTAFSLIEAINIGLQQIGSILVQYKNTKKKKNTDGIYVDRIIEKILSFSTTYLTNKNIELSFFLNAPECQISVSQTTFERIISNILSNAEYAIAENGQEGRIKISTEIANQPDNVCVITISDNGIGMSEDTLKNACCNDYTTKPQMVGKGIGMYYIKKTLDQLGGKISIDSSLKTGTTIKLLFPILTPNQVFKI